MSQTVVDSAARGHRGTVKLLWFHLMPYPELPEDFNQKHRSVWVDIDPGLFDRDVLADATSATSTSSSTPRSAGSTGSASTSTTATATG